MTLDDIMVYQDDIHNITITTTTTTNITHTNASAATVHTLTIIPPITSEQVLWYFRLIAHGILGQILAVMGSATNAINILVFLKLGVRKDPMNVSLLGLSVSDFASCFSVIFVNLCLTPGFTEIDSFPFSPLSIHYLFSTWPHAICVKITILITAFITIERCLCVTYPLKIKQLFTPRRVALIITSLYLVIIFLTAPIYHMFRMKWVFYPGQNRTIYTLIYHEDKEKIEPPLYTVFSLIIPPTAFVATILSTIILVYNLKKMAKWRSGVTSTSTTSSATVNKKKSSSTSDNANTSTSSTSSSKSPQLLQQRDTKVAKMVAVISTLYIVCYLPVTAAIFISVIEPKVSQGGVYQNTLYAIFAPMYVLEATNASLNIFIYYKMSTNYKDMFRSIFFRGKQV